MGICISCKKEEVLENSDLCEDCDALQDMREALCEQEQKYLAEEAYGIKQCSQEEIEDMFIECIDQISKEIDSRLDNEFGPNRFNLKISDIDNNFLGELLNIKVHDNEIGVNVMGGFVSDDPGNVSSVDLLLCVNGTKIYSESIEHINGQYGDGDLVQDEFLFTESYIESFAERVVCLINSMI